MIKYQLHKLPEGFILTSDETIKTDDVCYYTQSGKSLTPPKNGIYNIIKTSLNTITFSNNLGTVDKVLCKKVIAQKDQIDLSALSEADSKKIGWFDIEELSRVSFPVPVKLAKRGCQYHDMLGLNPMKGYKKWNKAFNKGFKKAQELLSDRSFTLEEIKSAFEAGYQCRNNSGYKVNGTYKKDFDKYFQSLQNKSWYIELETFESHSTLNGRGEEPKNITEEIVSRIDNKVKVIKVL